jgi:DNA-binding MarR family transcriptional regulator
MKTEWMGEYRELVEKMILLCNVTSWHFAKPAYFNTPIKITATEIQIIEYTLEERDENMTKLSTRLGVSKSVFSKYVNKLIIKKLIKKEHRADNQKEFFLYVTPHGQEIYNLYSQFIYERWFKEMFAMADRIPKEYIKIFEDMLQGFADTIV